MVTKLRTREAETLNRIVTVFGITATPNVSHDDLEVLGVLLQAEERQRSYTRAVRIINLVFAGDKNVTGSTLRINAMAYEHPVQPRTDAPQREVEAVK